MIAADDEGYLPVALVVAS